MAARAFAGVRASSGVGAFVHHEPASPRKAEPLNSTSNSHPIDVGQTWSKVGSNKKTIFSPKWRLNCARSTKVLMSRVFLRLKDGTRLWPDYLVGFWIEAPALVAEMRRDSSCRPLVDKFDGVPVLFVPTASLMYLIASKE